MTTWTDTRSGIQAAAQKASDAYAVARQAQEALRGLTERIAALEDENARLWAVIEAPKQRRKAA